VYSKSDRTGQSDGFYIPHNYRGNALYFERMSRDVPCTDDDSKGNEERERDQTHPCGYKSKEDHEREYDCAHRQDTADGCGCEKVREPEQSCRECRTGSPSFLSSLFGSGKSDSILIILLVLFFLLSGKDKEGARGDDNTMLLLLLVLLL